MNQPVPPLPPARRNPVASFFIGLWDVMNFTRRLILNLVFFGLLFLLLVMFVIAAGMGAGASKSLQDRTTLVIAPEGRLVEQFSADPVSRALAKAVGDNGAEEIQLRDLVKEALRMRPSRILVGEVRAEECLDLLLALNAGLPGMCTLHANSAREALVKMCTLPLLAGDNSQ